MMQTSGKVVAASITGSARQGFILIPLLLILSSVLGVTGIQMAQPLADFGTMLVSIPFVISYFREMDRDSVNNS